MSAIDNFAAVLAGGKLEVFATGERLPGIGGRLYRGEVIAHNSWRWIEYPAPNTTGGIEILAVPDPDGHPDVLVNSGDDQLYCLTTSTAGWVGWLPLHRPEPTFHAYEMTAARREGGGLDVVVVGARPDQSARKAWHRRRDEHGTWAAWTALPGEVAGPVTAAVNLDGRLEIFVVNGLLDHGGVQTSLRHRFEQADGKWSAWTAWDAAHGVSIEVRPLALRNPDGCLELFVVGGDGSVWHRRQKTPGGNWTPDDWEPLGGKNIPGHGNLGTVTAFTVAPTAAGALELIVAHGYGKNAAARRRSADGETWQAWRALASGDYDSLQLAAGPDGRLSLFTYAALWNNPEALWRMTQEAPESGTYLADETYYDPTTPEPEPLPAPHQA